MRISTNIVILGIILYVVAIWFIPELYRHRLENDSSLSTLEIQTLLNECRKIITQAFAGLAILATVYGTLERIANSELTTNIALTKQLNDRFSSAVSQLAHESMTIKTAGVYALEQVARESPDTYHQPVYDILYTYFQENALKFGTPEEMFGVSVAPDIQTILTVLTRRDKAYDATGFSLDLSRRNLGGVNLRNADLTGAKMSISNFALSDFSGANLSGAEIKDANLEGAKLIEAKLINADLGCFDFFYGKCNGVGTNVHGADFSGADLTGAKLMVFTKGADDEGFIRTRFTGAVLDSVDFGNGRGASRLSFTDFNGASIRGAKIGWMNTFEWSSFNNAVFHGTVIEDGVHTSIYSLLSAEQLKQVVFPHPPTVTESGDSISDQVLEGLRNIRPEIFPERFEDDK